MWPCLGSIWFLGGVTTRDPQVIIPKSHQVTISCSFHGEAMNTLRQELVDDGWLDPSGGMLRSWGPSYLPPPVLNR